MKTLSFIFSITMEQKIVITISAYTKSADLILRPSKNYSSRDTISLNNDAGC
jgi:hypothetical protein